MCEREKERKVYWPIHFHSPSLIISKVQAIPKIYFFTSVTYGSLCSHLQLTSARAHAHFFFRNKETKSNNKLPKKKQPSCSSSVDGRGDGKGALLELCPPVGELCQPEHHFNSGCTLNHLLQTCITHYGHTLCVSPAISGSPSQTGHPPPAVGGEQDTQEPSGLWR